MFFCSFSFWSFYCLFFFDLRFLITPIVSSNYSYKQIMIFQIINRQLRVNRKNLMKSEFSFLLNVNKIIKRNTISYWEASHCVSLNLISFRFYWKPDKQDRCLTFCPFTFGHCAVCSSSIYGFWLPLWYLQTLLVKPWINFFYVPCAMLSLISIHINSSNNTLPWVVNLITRVSSVLLLTLKPVME